MATVQCSRCGTEKPALANPPFRPGTKLAPLGLEIQQTICADCYKDWIAMSVKLVNETRLDTTDPRGQELWLAQMKLFLGLDKTDADPWSRLLDKRVSVETTAGVTTTATLIGLNEQSVHLAEFVGGEIPVGFDRDARDTRGSASIPRDAIRVLARADPA